jgi:hypothetical protein
MNKCGSCNGSLKDDETSCFQCDTPVPPKVTKVSLQQRFRTVIKVTLVLSAIMTVASLFFDFTPSFIKCVVATMILALVKSSAEQMSQSE